MRIIGIFILLISTLHSKSQINKGQWIAGGQGSFAYSKSKNLKQTSLQLSPSAGFFFAHRLAGGLRLFYNSETYKWEEDSKDRWSGYGFTPFVRYYLLQEDQKVNFFADVSFGLGWGQYKDVDEGDKHTYNYYTTSLITGPAIFLNKNTALELTIGYQYSSRGPIDSTKTSSIRAGVGLQFHFGNKKE